MRLVCSIAFLIAQADASWLSGSVHERALLRRTSVARCNAPLMQQAKKKRASKNTKEEENPELQRARTTILAEVEKEQRSLEAIASALAILEAAPPPAKLKRAVTGDWKLVFASDAAAVEPFSVGTASGPFVVLEDIYHRMQTAGETVQSIEGEYARSAFGRWAAIMLPDLLRSAPDSLPHARSFLRPPQWCVRSALSATAARRSMGAGALVTLIASRGRRNT